MPGKRRSSLHIFYIKIEVTLCLLFAINLYENKIRKIKLNFNPYRTIQMIINDLQVQKW